MAVDSPLITQNSTVICGTLNAPRAVNHEPVPGVVDLGIRTRYETGSGMHVESRCAGSFSSELRSSPRSRRGQLVQDANHSQLTEIALASCRGLAAKPWST